MINSNVSPGWQSNVFCLLFLIRVLSMKWIYWFDQKNEQQLSLNSLVGSCWKSVFASSDLRICLVIAFHFISKIILQRPTP